MNMPRLHADPSRRHARRWLRRAVRLIGPGFHPEAAPSQYESLSGEPTFTSRQARLLEYDLQRAEQVLGQPVFESISQTVQWQCMRLRLDPATELLIELEA